MVSLEIELRLKKNFKRHFPNTPWQEIEEFFGFKNIDKLGCYYCKDELIIKSIKTPTIEHKNPSYLGGKNFFENIAIACFRCNYVKGSLTENEFKKLISKFEEREMREVFLNEIFGSKRYAKRKIKKTKEKRFLHEFA